MRFDLTIACNNAAFTEDGAVPGAEVARLLREAADKVQDAEPGAIGVGALRDYNGNTVGRYHFTEE